MAEGPLAKLAGHWHAAMTCLGRNKMRYWRDAALTRRKTGP